MADDHESFPTSNIVSNNLLADGKLAGGSIWEELMYFLAVAKTRSLNSAAKLVGSTGPTVGRKVQRLEDALDKKLLVVNNCGAQLTDIGLELATNLARLDLQLGDIVSNLGAPTGEPEGETSIAITEGMATGLLTLPVGEFSRKYPKCRLSFKNPRNLSDIIESRTDILLSFVKDSSTEVVCRELGTAHLIPVVSKIYIEEYGIPTLDNLDQHRFVRTDMYDTTKEFWQDWGQLTARGERSHQCENSVTYGAFVKAGYGIGLLSSFVTLDPMFQHVDLGYSKAVKLYGIARRNALLRPAVSATFAWLCETFSADNPWLSDTLSLENNNAESSETFRFVFNI